MEQEPPDAAAAGACRTNENQAGAGWRRKAGRQARSWTRGPGAAFRLLNSCLCAFPQDGGVLAGPAEHQLDSHQNSEGPAAAQSHQQSAQ